MPILHEWINWFVGGGFINESKIYKKNVGFFIKSFDMKVVMESMVRDKAGSVSNFTEQDVFKCLYFISIRFFGRAPNLESVCPNRFEK